MHLLAKLTGAGAIAVAAGFLAVEAAGIGGDAWLARGFNDAFAQAEGQRLALNNHQAGATVAMAAAPSNISGDEQYWLSRPADNVAPVRLKTGLDANDWKIGTQVMLAVAGKLQTFEIVDATPIDIEHDVAAPAKTGETLVMFTARPRGGDADASARPVRFVMEVARGRQQVL